MKPFRVAFVSAVGAYLGWHICEGLDRKLGPVIAVKIQPIIDKLNEKGDTE